jgi:hypothetical protein
MYDAPSHLFNLDDGVFPGFGAGQDLVYVLEQGGRHLVVIGPGDGRGPGDGVVENIQHDLKKRVFREHIRITIQAWQGGKNAKSHCPFLLDLCRGEVSNQVRGGVRDLGPGRRAKDWLSSSHSVEPYWFWTAWSRCKIRLVHKRDGYVSLPCRRFCASLLL